MTSSNDTNNLAVIGIDPGPRKGATVCYESPDGLCFEEWEAKKVKIELDQWCKKAKEQWHKQRLLITWDAPLTGPYWLNTIENLNSEKIFTQRILDKVFLDKDKNEQYSPPPGISVIGYGSCFHWTISQYVLGLPHVSEYHTGSLFPLAVVKEHEKYTARYQDFQDNALIAEVHPALGMWLFLKDNTESTITNWRYKGKQARATRGDLITELEKKFGRFMTDEMKAKMEASDDHLDAWLAWLLGKLWVLGDAAEEHSVDLVGTASTGAMLLPCTNEQKKALTAELQRLGTELLTTH